MKKDQPLILCSTKDILHEKYGEATKDVSTKTLVIYDAIHNKQPVLEQLADYYYFDTNAIKAIQPLKIKDGEN